MKKLPCFTKPKNRDGYYFTPTVDGKTKWIPLGTDKQVALEKYHIHMQGESRARFVNEALDLYLNDGGDIDLSKTSLRPFSDLAEQSQKSYRQVIAKIRKQFGKRELVSLRPNKMTQWVVTIPDGNRAIAMLNNIFELGNPTGRRAGTWRWPPVGRPQQREHDSHLPCGYSGACAYAERE